MVSDYKSDSANYAGLQIRHDSKELDKMRIHIYFYSRDAKFCVSTFAGMLYVFVCGYLADGYCSLRRLTAKKKQAPEREWYISRSGACIKMV